MARPKRAKSATVSAPASAGSQEQKQHLLERIGDLPFLSIVRHFPEMRQKNSRLLHRPNNRVPFRHRLILHANQRTATNSGFRPLVTRNFSRLSWYRAALRRAPYQIMGIDVARGIAARRRQAEDAADGRWSPGSAAMLHAGRHEQPVERSEVLGACHRVGDQPVVVDRGLRRDRRVIPTVRGFGVARNAPPNRRRRIKPGTIPRTAPSSRH